MSYQGQLPIGTTYAMFIVTTVGDDSTREEAMKRYLAFLKKTISRILILAMLHLCWLTSYGWAEMMNTESSLQSQTDTQTDRQRILDLLNRQEVADELEKYGISKVEAVARINSLTDEEVATLAAQIDQLPAGGNIGNVIGIAIILAFYAVVSATYILGVFFKGIECTFSDCEAKGGAGYIFTPWWKGAGNSSIEEDDLEEEECDPGMESCP